MGIEQVPIHDAQRQDHPRIKTQIHRRKKAKALSPMELEWDHIDGTAPSSLRMSSDRMVSTPLPKGRIPHK
jgi:hypothetical protein